MGGASGARAGSPGFLTSCSDSSLRIVSRSPSIPTESAVDLQFCNFTCSIPVLITPETADWCADTKTRPRARALPFPDWLEVCFVEPRVMTKPRPRVAPPASSGRSASSSVREADGVSTTHAQGTSDAFFRHIVSGMRNGVLAITRDGRLALINDEAYRIFGVTSPGRRCGAPDWGGPEGPSRRRSRAHRCLRSAPAPEPGRDAVEAVEQGHRLHRDVRARRRRTAWWARRCSSRT